ncbi:iron-containing alcohol dehydrogenase [Aminithiophilus ramosus]|uniref:Iron-containing alcohol dehydrogenase n=2 Tax=Synergistales TaxID=649776 RepID=A0A9Q7AQY9_9BACT|nr:iron-containing alcohol dehydrogenase [Aminithiophilus ramosus]QTX32406.1 iron-containing alcohol dehydrogenase [Aminithiophilus ramosus]QVL36283.1 iron-containing alcohol dehydrogenase [Synergistota bacterium]
MRDFTFQNGTKILFGRAAEERVGAETAPLAATVLLHYGGGSVKRSGLYDRIAASLADAAVDVVELGGVQPNPRLSLVERGIELGRRERIGLVLAVGGGSVIDSAKAIALGIPASCGVWDFFEGISKPERALPVGVVLTLPAAGSETSPVSVITNEEGLYKRGFRNGLLRPRFALLNPELTFSLPADQTRFGAVDMLAHVMERYFTNEADVELTDRLCEATMKTIIANLPRALARPDDYAARAELMWASTIAHNDLLDTGREGDWASHRIEHELSALYDVAHGAGLAVVFPAWMDHVVGHDLRRFAQFAHRVWDVEPDFFDMERTAREGIARFRAFLRSCGLATTLKELSIGDDRFDEMARKAVEKGPVGTFVPLGEEDVRAVLERCR